MTKNAVAVVMGPTASGKSALALELAERYNGEIVCADSMQIYRGMDIGTAKPTAAERMKIRHHMVDFVSPAEKFSVSDYVNLASKCIAEIQERKKLPVVVGGTGLYIRALLENMPVTEGEGDEALRAALVKRAAEEGGTALLEEIRSFDPGAAERISVNDTRRLVRAIEVYRTTGMTMTQRELLTESCAPRYDAVKMAIVFSDRQKLYDRINRRVDRMMEDGLLEEAREFFRSGAGNTAAQAIGYKELREYFSGEIPLSEAVERIKRETRRYAKRQMTWLRREKELVFLEGDCPKEELLSKAEALLARII